METVVIIPNWNGKHLLQTCLKSLKRQSYKNFKTIVVDNGSTDGSKDFIKKEFPEVILIELDKNYGFAKAVNTGIKNSRERYIILINNDTEVDKNCISHLVSSARKQKKVGFVTAKILQFYKRNIIDSAGDYIDTVGHANNLGFGEADGPMYKKPGYVFLVSGGGSLFKRQVFEKVGLFDEDFFAYMEDVDLCLRAQLEGFKGWFEPMAIIYHIHKATSSKDPEFLEYLQFRNMTQTIIKNFPLRLLLRNFNFFLIILVNLNTIRFLASQGLILQALKAEFYTILNLPKLLTKRWKIQSKKKVSDEYIIENIRDKKITFFGLFNS